MNLLDILSTPHNWTPIRYITSSSNLRSNYEINVVTQLLVGDFPILNLFASDSNLTSRLTLTLSETGMHFFSNHYLAMRKLLKDCESPSMSIHIFTSNRV